jgi:hypothetical protein
MNLGYPKIHSIIDTKIRYRYVGGIAVQVLMLNKF